NGCAVAVAAGGSIQNLGDRRDWLQQSEPPVLESDLAASVAQMQPRFAAAQRNLRLVVVDLGLLIGRDHWAVLQQAEHQQRLDESQLRLVDPERRVGIDVQCPDLDVFD